MKHTRRESKSRINFLFNELADFFLTFTKSATVPFPFWCAIKNKLPSFNYHEGPNNINRSPVSVCNYNFRPIITEHRKMFVTWAALCIGLVAAVGSEVEDCTREKLNQCTYSVSVKGILDDDELFPKKEHLDEYCGPLLNDLKCTIDFSDRCLDSDIDDVAKMERQMFDLLTSLCDDSSEIKKGYLDNVECYENNTMQVIICYGTTLTLLEDFLDERENRIDDFSPIDIMQLCVGLPHLVNCIVTAIAEECGNEETVPLAQILSRTSDMFLENECPTDKIAIWNEEFYSYLEEDKKRRR